MKTTIAVCAALLLTLMAITYAQNTKAPVATQPTQGKFQIVPAEYLYLGKGSSSTRPGVYRINTETGETWLFAAGIDDQGKLFQYWDQIR